MKIISKTNWKSYDRPDIRTISYDYFLPQPGLLEPGANKEEALLIVQKVLGVDIVNPQIEIITPIGKVNIHNYYLPHIVEKRESARERFANYILPALQSPFEIYNAAYEDNKERLQYIGLFKGGTNMLVVVEVLSSHPFLFWNMMQTDMKRLNSHRRGELIWYKKNALPNQ